MQTTNGTYYKAFLLALVFSLNTIVSFACSFSNLFHGIHHHDSGAVSSAEHHHSSTDHSSQSDQHEHKESDHHQHNDFEQHKHGAANSEDSKDGCCSESVVQIEKVEKALSRSIEAPHTLFIASFFAAFSSYLFQLETIEDTSIPPNIRWRLLATIPDLRIVIQSFQI